jgi:3'(2'), 5'-bisphosphate nucleotidase
MEALRGSPLAEQMVQALKQVSPDMDFGSALQWVAKGDFTGGAEGGFWTIDPIDGTKGFIRNQQYAVALSYVVDGQPVVGVLGCPNYSRATVTGLVFSATAGSGAFVESIDGITLPRESVAVSPAVGAPADAKLCESVESAHSSHDDSDQLKSKLGIHKESLRIDSQCKYAAVASGDADIYLRFPTSDTYREKIWDHAAGFVVATEAGAKVTDIHGNALDFSLGQKLESNQGIITAHQSIHEAVVAAIRGLKEG